jgi:hypothetical protein
VAEAVALFGRQAIGGVDKGRVWKERKSFQKIPFLTEKKFSEIKIWFSFFGCFTFKEVILVNESE